jgi:hypothetical protein
MTLFACLSSNSACRAIQMVLDSGYPFNIHREEMCYSNIYANSIKRYFFFERPTNILFSIMLSKMISITVIIYFSLQFLRTILLYTVIIKIIYEI